MKHEVATVCATLNPLPNHFSLCLEGVRDLPQGHGKVLLQVHQNAQSKVQGCTATEFGVSALLRTLILKPKQHKNHKTLTDVL